MSIRPHILGLEKAGKLWRYAPPGLPAKRRLYLTENAVRDLQDANGIIPLMGLRGMVEGGLKRWVHGDRVFTDLNGKPRFLKDLSPPPPEIWEIRFTDPRVQVRLFCRFAEPDTIIGTKFHTRQLLGKKGSEQWRAALEACEKTWKELFPTFPPFSGKTIHDYVTENCDDFPIWN
jgi:hypothetical protein